MLGSRVSLEKTRKEWKDLVTKDLSNAYLIDSARNRLTKLRLWVFW